MSLTWTTCVSVYTTNIANDVYSPIYHDTLCWLFREDWEIERYSMVVKYRNVCPVVISKYLKRFETSLTINAIYSHQFYDIYSCSSGSAFTLFYHQWKVEHTLNKNVPSVLVYIVNNIVVCQVNGNMCPLNNYLQTNMDQQSNEKLWHDLWVNDC